MDESNKTLLLKKVTKRSGTKVGVLSMGKSMSFCKGKVLFLRQAPFYVKYPKPEVSDTAESLITRFPVWGLRFL